METKDMIKITEEEFQEYEDVRESGVTNMFNVRQVEDLSGLSMKKIMFIMAHYDSLMDQYPKVRKD